MAFVQSLFYRLKIEGQLSVASKGGHAAPRGIIESKSKSEVERGRKEENF